MKLEVEVVVVVVCLLFHELLDVCLTVVSDNEYTLETVPGSQPAFCSQRDVAFVE